MADAISDSFREKGLRGGSERKIPRWLASNGISALGKVEEARKNIVKHDRYLTVKYSQLFTIFSTRVNRDE
jgi:hypothetical protein